VVNHDENLTGNTTLSVSKPILN